MNHDLTELIDDLPTEALELYVMEWEGPGVGDYWGDGFPMSKGFPVLGCRCPRAALGYHHMFDRTRDFEAQLADSRHPADMIEFMACRDELDTEALYRACKAGILARDAAVERVREEVMVG